MQDIELSPLIRIEGHILWGPGKSKYSYLEEIISISKPRTCLYNKMAGQKMLLGRSLVLWKVILSLKSLVSNILRSINLTVKDFCVESLQQYKPNILLTFLKNRGMKITFNEMSVKSIEQNMCRKAQYYSEKSHCSTLLLNLDGDRRWSRHFCVQMRGMQKNKIWSS